MAMRNCSLDNLSLSPLNTSPSSDSCDQNFSGDRRQELTIFYNGRVCSFDLAELQARAILLLASQGMGGTASSTADKALHLEAATVPSEDCTSRLCGPQATGLSIKKSLQSFLQERKRRAKASSPYCQ